MCFIIRLRLRSWTRRERVPTPGIGIGTAAKLDTDRRSHEAEALSKAILQEALIRSRQVLGLRAMHTITWAASSHPGARSEA